MTPTARYPSLEGRVCLVTGGGSGIGATIVSRLVEQGAKVAFLDIDEKASRALVDQCSANKPLFIRCDLRDIEALRRAVDDVGKQLGPIRVLVNNAARDDRHKWDEVTPEYWDQCLQVNLRHQFFAAQAVVPQMEKAGGGSIVNFGSVSWMRSLPGMVGYTTAKAAINGLTRTLAREFGEKNIRVNCVVPGAIVTERQRQLWSGPAQDKEILDLQALKFRLTPEHVAPMVLFLAADDSAGCSGQNFIVNGGNH
ncbi:MAG: SDR family oxidoreductase [Alphaproteobacteria bacterium]|nr:SDR family oxidoreductase [Alphaproteobacteria bacterium]